MTSDGLHGISSGFYEWIAFVLVTLSNRENSESSETRKNLTIHRITFPSSNKKNIREDAWELNAGVLKSNRVGPELYSLLTSQNNNFPFFKKNRFRLQGGFSFYGSEEEQNSESKRNGKIIKALTAAQSMWRDYFAGERKKIQDQMNGSDALPHFHLANFMLSYIQWMYILLMKFFFISIIIEITISLLHVERGKKGNENWVNNKTMQGCSTPKLAENSPALYRDVIYCLLSFADDDLYAIPSLRSHCFDR